jgi:hypothetical protein
MHVWRNQNSMSTITLTVKSATANRFVSGTRLASASTLLTQTMSTTTTTPHHHTTTTPHHHTTTTHPHPTRSTHHHHTTQPHLQSASPAPQQSDCKAAITEAQAWLLGCDRGRRMCRHWQRPDRQLSRQRRYVGCARVLVVADCTASGTFAHESKGVQSARIGWWRLERAH